MTTPYNLSTDYEGLFALLQQGNTIVGFVQSDRYVDDVVKIQRFENGTIRLMARGIEYSSLPDYWREFPKAYGTGTEIEAFRSVCESVNLKWVKP